MVFVASFLLHLVRCVSAVTRVCCGAPLFCVDVGHRDLLVSIIETNVPHRLLFFKSWCEHLLVVVVVKLLD